MKEKLALVIAVLMLASMAFVISTTTVSATHTSTVSIDDDTVKANTTMVRTITVQNAGPDAIDNVWIVVPSGFTAFAPVMKIPKDNEVTLEDNVVTLKAGTLIELNATATLKAPGGTPVIIPKGTTIRWEPVTAVTGVLNENLSAKIENFVKNVGTGSVTAVGDFENSIAAAENENVAADIQITLASAYGTARLLAETRVVRGTGNMVRLPENTLVALVSATTASIGADNKVSLTKERVATLNADNTIDPPSDNDGRIFVALAGATTNTIYTVSANDNVLVVDSAAITENIIFPAGTVLKFAVTATVDVWDNTKVVRAVNENMKMTAATATATENDPKNWSQSVAASSTAPPGTYVEWENNVGIASGASLAFPFAVTTPSTGGDYTIYVKTTDTTGLSAQKEITLTIDNTSPTVTIVASPSWIGENLDVTIKLTASESLAKLENVMVAENNAPENTQITMTPESAENKVWTGTYKTGDNTQRDGTATIYVIGSQFEDLVGNAGVDNTGTFGVDRLKPPTPNVTQITGFPTDAATTLAPGIQTKLANWFIENIALDNVAGSLVVQKDMTVKIRIGTTVSDIITPASGYYSKSITLSEGTQEIGIKYIDKAGNVGMEDNENVTLDSTKPSISITSPADGATIVDNTPLISLTIADATLGVENATPYAFADNSGYTVQLRRDNDNVVIATLTPKTFPTADPFKSFTFENQWPTELSEIAYNIFVQAGDNLQKDNIFSRFTVDITAPGTPSLDVTVSTDIDDPTVIKTASRTVTGTAEAGAKIKVYFNGAEQTALETTTDVTTGAWSIIVSPTPGTTTKIEFRAVDKAGNEGSKVLYGYLLVDGSAPTVSITAPESGISTDATSIILEATVTKDTWEEYSELTVRIDATSLTAPLTATNVLSATGVLTRAVEMVEGTNTISVSAQDVAGNWSTVKTVTVTRTVTPWATYAIIIVIVALILAAIAIFRKR